MKLKIVRQSGAPVDLESIDAFRSEFQTKYDAILDQYGTNMQEVERALTDLDAELAPKYDTIKDVQLPSSGKAWQDMLKLYNTNAIMITTHAQTGELLLAILDLGI